MLETELPANSSFQHPFTLDGYAVNILHDENKNGKIDKGLIMPNEGIGFSNFQSIGFSNRPSFSKASFRVNENKLVSVKMIYM